MKVGELARRTGLTVRTLHRYDDIGLLQPSARSAAGHRLYNAADILRLQQIVALRQLDLPLAAIQELIGSEGSGLRLITQQIERVREQIRAQQELCANLEAIAARLRDDASPTLGLVLETLEMMNMVKKYYSDEQLDYLRQRREAVGEERIAEVEAEWPRLMDEVRREMEAGTAADDPKLQRLMQRWKALVAEFTGGDAGIERSLNDLYEGEDEVPAGSPVDRELFDYVARAMRAQD